MEIGSIAKDLFSEVRERTKNRILSTLILSWALNNTQHIVNVVFAEKITPSLVNSELHAAVINMSNWIVIPIIASLHIYLIPKLNQIINAAVFQYIEKPAQIKAIKGNQEIEIERIKQIEVISNRNSSLEIRAKLDTLESERYKNIAEIRRLTSEVNDSRMELSKTKLDLANAKATASTNNRALRRLSELTLDITPNIVGEKISVRELLESQGLVMDESDGLKESRLDGTLDANDLDEEIRRYEEELALEKAQERGAPKARSNIERLFPDLIPISHRIPTRKVATTI